MFVLLQAHGDEYQKPLNKLNIAQNLMRLAAYGTPTLFLFYDLDEFLIIPSEKPITSLVSPGGCLSGVRKHAQALLRSMITVATTWRNADPSVVGELPAWLAHDVWVDALKSMNYSMAPQRIAGWKAIVDPNFDYNFNCKSRQSTLAPSGQTSCKQHVSCGSKSHSTISGSQSLVLLPDASMWAICLHPVNIQRMQPDRIVAQLCAGHDHFERSGDFDVSQINFVSESCAYHMHFTNWFENRVVTSSMDRNAINIQGDFVPLEESQLAKLRTVYQTSECNFPEDKSLKLEEI